MITLKIKKTSDVLGGFDRECLVRTLSVIKMICKSTPEMQEYIGKIAQRSHLPSALDSTAALLLLLETCAELGLSPKELSLVRDANGRPYFSDMPHIDFNISHSGGYVAVALSLSEPLSRVGVDIESADRKLFSDREKRLSLAKRFFSKAECDLLSSRDGDKETFLSLWTRKEAYIKYTGLGLSSLTETDTLSPLEVRFITDSPSSINRDRIFTLCIPQRASDPEIRCELL